MSSTQDGPAWLSADLEQIIAEQERIFAERQPQSRQMAAGRTGPGRRGHVKLADHRPAAGLAQPRPRLEDL